MSVTGTDAMATAATLQDESARGGYAAEYLEKGYLIVPGVLGTQEVRELERDVVKVATGGYPCQHFRPLPTTLSEREVFERVLSLHEAHLISPVISSFVTHPAISAILRQIVGAHLRGWSGDVKCAQTMYYAKPPNMAGHPWHQDEAFFPTRDRSLTAVYIAIDDIDAANGCLWFVPASHRYGYMYPRAPHRQAEEYLFEIGSTGFTEAEMVPVEMRAGSVAFFNGYTLHRSTRNRSDRFRRVLVNHYCNAWSLLPRIIPAGTEPGQMGEEIGLADDRKVLQVCGQDPYVDKGYDHANRHTYMIKMNAGT